MWNWVTWQTWIRFSVQQMWHNNTVQLLFWFLCQFNSKINKWTHSEDVWQQKLMMFYLQHKKGELWVNQTNLMEKKGTICRKNVHAASRNQTQREERRVIVSFFCFWRKSGDVQTKREHEELNCLLTDVDKKKKKGFELFQPLKANIVKIFRHSRGLSGFLQPTQTVLVLICRLLHGWNSENRSVWLFENNLFPPKLCLWASTLVPNSTTSVIYKNNKTTKGI